MAYTPASQSGLAYAFPAELDEFLDICVEEHGEDWELISFAFLEIADGLDETLAERASSFFSPATLQQRWLELCNNFSASNETVPLATTVAGDCCAGAAGIAAAEEIGSVEAGAGIQFTQQAVSYGEPQHCKSQTPEHWYVDVRAQLPTTMDSDQAPLTSEQESDLSEGDDDIIQSRSSIKTASRSLIANQPPTHTSRHRWDHVIQSLQNNSPNRRLAQKLPAQPGASTSQASRELASTRGEVQETAVTGELEVEDEEDANNEDDELDNHDPKRVSIRVMRRLLRCAPSGECTWSIWLEATHQWPRLQSLVGNPEFCQRGSSLKAIFDVGMMRQVLQTEEEAYDEYRQSQVACSQKSAEELIKETERRREMLGKALGSLLHSSIGSAKEPWAAASQLAKI